MKFYCHRCNKPYLIADERIRGKILKIRCKNCSAVITVRERMDHDSRSGRPSGRRQSTTSAPELSRLTPDPSAPGRASSPVLASRSTPAPGGHGSSPDMIADDASLLGDDWYLSVDGDQEGPFPPERAREWIAARAPDDEIYCWRDGFDDWLPVEDVSEFQGVRRHSRLALMPPPATPAPSVAQATRSSAPGTRDSRPGSFAGDEEVRTTVESSPYALEELGLVPGGDARAASGAGEQRAPSAGRGSAPSNPRITPAPDGSPASEPRLDAGAGPWLGEGESGPELAARSPSPYPSLADVRSAAHQDAEPASDASSGGARRRWPGILLGIALFLGIAAGAVAAYYFVLDDTWGPAGARSELTELTPSDVSGELQTAANQAALKQCYERARQEEPGLDVERIEVELVVDASGQVTRVALSEQQDTTLGTCLAESIRTWSFRESASGISTRVPLIFQR